MRRAGCGRRRSVAEIARRPVDRVGDGFGDGQAVTDGVRHHERHRRAAAFELLHAEVPRRAVFGVDRDVTAFVDPVVDLGDGSRPGSDVEVNRSGGADPPVAAERQRRPFDPAAQQATATQIAVQATQAIQVDRMFVDPGVLDQRAAAQRP